MALIAMDENNPPELRGRMFSELAQYIAPERRALDMDKPSTAPVTIRLGIPPKAVGGGGAAAHDPITD